MATLKPPTTRSTISDNSTPLPPDRRQIPNRSRKNTTSAAYARRLNTHPQRCQRNPISSLDSVDPWSPRSPGDCSDVHDAIGGRHRRGGGSDYDIVVRYQCPLSSLE
jgi:hypothetical protein